MVGIVIIMIDDILSLSEETTWKELFEYLKTKLQITGGDVASVWNGYELEKQSDRSLRVSQTKQIVEMLKKLDLGGRDCPLSDTPEDAKSKNWTSKEFMDDTGLNDPIAKLYQSVFGSLIYFSYKSTPDLAHAMSRCGQMASAASETNLKGLLKVVGYLKSNPDRPLVFRKGTGFQVAAFTDAGHANEEFIAQKSDLGGKSTTGSVVLFNGCAVAWKSKL